MNQPMRLIVCVAAYVAANVILYKVGEYVGERIADCIFSK